MAGTGTAESENVIFRFCEIFMEIDAKIFYNDGKKLFLFLYK